MHSFKVFIDLDGVMADFDKRAIEILGVRPRDFEGQEGADRLWEKIDAYPNFFLSLEPMKDAMVLWDGVEARGFIPTVLTGTPRWNNKENMDPSEQKRQWVLKHLYHGRTITCKSRDKCLHMEQPGDVLIDDWHRYAGLWREKGGKFILHTSAVESLKELDEYIQQRRDMEANSGF